MKNKILISTGAILLLSFLSFSVTEKISYRDLNSKYEITGPLDFSMGTAFEMEAKKVDANTKADDRTMEVLKVNGVALEKPVTMIYSTLLIDDTFEDGKIYKCKAYQDGAFRGTPQDVLKEEMIQTKAYHFAVELVIYKVL
jgi:hypothetical protein